MLLNTNKEPLSKRATYRLSHLVINEAACFSFVMKSGTTGCVQSQKPTCMAVGPIKLNMSLISSPGIVYQWYLLQYGSGKRTNFFFHFADQFYNPRFSAEWFGVNHSEWKKFTRSYALDIPRTFSGPQCTHDIRSVCEYLRVATDCSVQASLTTQIILSHDDNQTKIVTTAIIILTLVN